MKEFSRSRQFYLICLAFLAGIAIASWSPTGRPGSPLFLFCLLVGSLALSIIFWSGPRLRLGGLIAAALFFALWRYSLTAPAIGPGYVWYYNGQKMELSGRIIAEPDQRLDQVKYEVGDLKLDGRELAGRILLSNKLYPRMEFGQRLEFSCKLQAPRDRADFSYSRYLARYDIYSLCFFPEIKAIDPPAPLGVLERSFGLMLRLKNVLRTSLNTGLSEPEAALGVGMFLGSDQGLPSEVKNDFSRTGLSHIVAISGMNITIIAIFLSWLLLALGFWRRQIFYASSAIIALYIVLIGAPASAVRAGVMGFLFMLAVQAGRLSSIRNSLFAAATAMLVFEPRLLADDLGFILSFAALLSIVLFFEPLDRRSARLMGDKFKAVRQAATLTLAAQVLTWPLVAYNFSLVSLISPLANLASLWVLGPLTVAVFAALGLSLILPAAAVYFFLPARLLLKYLLASAALFAAPSWAAVDLKIASVWWLAAYYSLIFFLIARKKIV